jgi:hypothetical protein
VDPRASIPLIAPAALAVILLIYEMVSSNEYNSRLVKLRDFNSNSLC